MLNLITAKRFSHFDAFGLALGTQVMVHHSFWLAILLMLTFAIASVALESWADSRR